MGNDEAGEKKLPYPAALAPPGLEVNLWRVDVPDLPGCYVTGQTLAEAVTSTASAVEAWFGRMRAAGLPVPSASTIDAWARSPDYPGCFWFLVSHPQRVSVTGTEKRSIAATAAVDAFGEGQGDAQGDPSGKDHAVKPSLSSNPPCDSSCPNSDAAPTHARSSA